MDPLLKLDCTLEMLVPFAFRHALACARTVDARAIVGGGAMRDLLCRRPIKDIDIFVGPYVTLDQLNAAYGKPGRVTVSEWATGYLGMTDVKAVYEHGIMGVGMINTVVLKREMSLLEMLQRFDFGICQVALDGSGIWHTPAFMDDWTNLAFTLVRCDGPEDYDRSMARFDRLVQKYTGWHLMVPGNIQEKVLQWDRDELIDARAWGLA